MATTLPSEGHVIVTPELAREWLAQFNYKHQRKIRAYHVTLLKNEILRGRFREKTQIAFCRIEGRKGQFFLTNGQHTLSAIVAADEPVKLDVLITNVQSELEVADEYARHDTHLTRQLADSLVAHGLHIDLGITVTQLNWVSAASIYLARMKGELGFMVSAAHVSHDEKLEITKRYGPLGRDALGVIDIADKRKSFFVRKTTLAPVMAVYEKEPELCAQFFGGMAKDDGLMQGDPRKTLLEYLRSSVTGGNTVGRARLGAVRKAEHEVLKAIAVGWNAFVERKELRLIRVKFDEHVVEFLRVGTFVC